MGETVIDLSVERAERNLVWECQCGCPTFYAHEDGRLECSGCNLMQVGHEAGPTADAVLVHLARDLPGWVVANLGQDDNRQWWAELRQGSQTSFDDVVIVTKWETAGMALLAAMEQARERGEAG